jgi:predicted DCC family thiol-disulfide oxidoreductase YuxK
VLFGFYLAVQFLWLLLDKGGTSPNLAEGAWASAGTLRTLTLASGVVLAALFVLGYHARVTAVALCAVVIATATTDAALGSAWLPARGAAYLPALALLALHAIVPPAPYGSWAARARVDPRGDWSMPSWPIVVARTFAALAFPAALLVGIAQGGYAFLVPVVVPVLLLLFAFDPRWIPARWPGRRDRLFYDGTCGLCHGAVRFMLAEDRSGAAFALASLQGPTWEAAVPTSERLALPDSIAVRTEDGRLLTRSTAVIYLLERLGGLWRALGVAMRIVPRPIRDAVYDLVARIRYRVFGRANTLCPILPPDLRSRFLD